MVLDTQLDPAHRAKLLADLRAMPAHQLLLRTLIPLGWTIPYLCDVALSPDDMASLPPDVAVELLVILKPEWILARRSELASLTVVQELRTLNLTLASLQTTIVALQGTVLAQRAKTQNPGATPPPPPRSTPAKG